MDCPGFQLAKGSKIAPGATIKPVSHVRGARQKITIKVFRVIKIYLACIISNCKHVDHNDLITCC